MELFETGNIFDLVRPSSEIQDLGLAFQELFKNSAASEPRQIWLSNRMWSASHHFNISNGFAMAQHLNEVVSDEFECWGDKIADGASCKYHAQTALPNHIPVGMMFSQRSVSSLMTFALELRRILWMLREENWEVRHSTHINHAYTRLGSIRDCGEQLLMDRAVALNERLFDLEVKRQISERAYTYDMHEEISTDVQLRVWLCGESEAIFTMLAPEIRDTLKYVLFDIAYPLGREHGYGL
jgi:hypothetical protein